MQKHLRRFIDLARNSVWVLALWDRLTSVEGSIVTWVLASLTFFREIDWVMLFFVSLAIFSTVMAARRWWGEREEMQNGASLPSSPTQPDPLKNAKVIDLTEVPSTEPPTAPPQPVDVHLVLVPKKSPPTESPPSKPHESLDEPFVDKTPGELMDIYRCKGRTTTEADRIYKIYRGKKLCSKFILDDVKVYEDGHVSVSVNIGAHDAYGSVILRFSKSYKKYFEHRAPGFEFTATGKIDETDGHILWLEDCEIEGLA